MSTDTRWRQRYSNFQKSLIVLDNAIQADSGKEDIVYRAGIIHFFEMSFELAWKTLQDLLQAKGFEDVSGPRPVVQKAFQEGLLIDGDKWKEMLDSRNLATHAYEEEIAIDIANKIEKTYYFLLDDLDKKLAKETTE